MVLAPPPSAVPQIVLQNGRSLPIASVTLKKDMFEVKVDTDNFGTGSTIPFTSVDHVFGDKPPAINQAIALILLGKPLEGRKLLIPILADHKDTAKLPGNFWLEAARATLVANALEGAAPPCTAIGKEISEATPDPGPDPFVELGKALLMPITTKVSEREAALRALITDAMPTDLCAYASFFLAELLKKDTRNDAAIESYLAVPCLYPSGGLVCVGVAQLRAAQLLSGQETRRLESRFMIQAAMRNTKDTAAKDIVAKELENLK